MIKLLFFFAVISFSYCRSCPPWTTAVNKTIVESSTECMCGSSVNGIVHCNPETLKVSLLYCFCMTYSADLNETLVGACYERCAFKKTTNCRSFNKISANDTSTINTEMCGEFNRDGLQCGSCIEGYGLPVYSYTFQCVPCNATDLKTNLVKYVAVAFLPLIIFYLIVVIFKVRATSASMTAYVMMCQIITAPYIVRYTLVSDIRLYLSIKTLLTLFFSPWNLDILRLSYAPFCIHPSMTFLHVLTLEYLVGIFPMVLIMVTYAVVMLHDRYTLIIKACAPVRRIFRCIRKQWDVRGSLVQAFATFLLLSYVKILNVSFDILTPVTLYRVNGKPLGYFVYYSSNLPYFGTKHLPYGIMAIIMFTLINVLPVILLFLYTSSCFQKFLHCCHLNHPALHTFMDAFQGCYRFKPKDCRYFASLYLFMRILEMLTTVASNDAMIIPINGLCLLALSILVIVIKPYKHNLQNTLDATLFLLHASGYFMTITYLYSKTFEPQFPITKPYRVLLSILLISHFLYGIGLLLKEVTPHKPATYFQKFFRRFLTMLSATQNLDNEPLPYRLENTAEIVPLLK